jgi:hypothetical protein
VIKWCDQVLGKTTIAMQTDELYRFDAFAASPVASMTVCTLAASQLRMHNHLAMQKRRAIWPDLRHTAAYCLNNTADFVSGRWGHSAEQRTK